MLRIALVAALLASGCAGPDGKPANSEPNNGTPNSGTNNAGSNNVIVINGATNTRPNNVTTTNNASTNNVNNNTRPNTTGPECDGRADCGVDQECIDGGCADHAFCEGGALYEPGDGGCRANWTSCDGSDFEFACVAEGEWFCTCVQDGATGRTATFVDEPCSESGIHFAANAACGWVVPSVAGR